MEIPGLGPVVLQDSYGWYRSEPVPVPVLGAACRFDVEGYQDDPRKEDFHAAIASFLEANPSALHAAAPAIFAYYRDVKTEVGDEDDFPAIAEPDDVWQHIQLGREVSVERDTRGDGRVYLSLECECAWEPEHGLQIVFRDGIAVTKVGPYDGHVTNANAYGRADLRDAVYHPVG
jgi:hypothetical protein